MQQVGGRSFAITLPKEWALQQGVGNRSIVFTEQLDDSLIISMNAPTEAYRELSVKLNDIEALAEFIVLCYVRNVNTLRLHGNVTYRQIVDVKQALRHLEGYELIRSDEKSIEIQFSYRDVMVTMPQVVHRMIYLLEMLLTAVREGDQQNQHEFEISIDCLYHLSTRMIAACVSQPPLRKQHRIASGEQLLFTQAITKRLEHIGDQLFQLQGKSHLDYCGECLKFIRDVLESKLPIRVLGKRLEQLRKALPAKAPRPVERILELCEDVYENQLSIRYDRQFFANQ